MSKTSAVKKETKKKAALKIPSLGSDLLEHALAASSCAITIADATKKDMPLIYINKTFQKMTGYKPNDILGRNCRFLQGKDRKQKGIAEIRKALRAKKECFVRLRNYREDGTLFWNELRLSPVFDARKKLTHYIGVQTDITQRVMQEEELNRHRDHLENLVAERTRKLEDKRIALQEVLSQVELEKKKVKDQVTENVDTVVLPLLHKMRERLDDKDKKYVDLMQKSLEELTEAFGQNITRKLYKLTPREIEISNMIRSGLSSKDIAQFFHVALSTIENQRNTIRKKLGISSSKVNLTTFLQSLSSDL